MKIAGYEQSPNVHEGLNKMADNPSQRAHEILEATLAEMRPLVPMGQVDRIIAMRAIDRALATVQPPPVP